MVRGGTLIWSEGTSRKAAGGIVAVIGSNGSGKTSLLNVIPGPIPPASGHVRVLGKPPGEVNEFIGYAAELRVGAGDDPGLRCGDAFSTELDGVLTSLP